MVPTHASARGSRLTGLVGLMMRDMVLTNDEVVGLRDGLLTSGEPPTGATRLSDWLAENGEGLGRRYVSELRRNYRGWVAGGDHGKVGTLLLFTVGTIEVDGKRYSIGLKDLEPVDGPSEEETEAADTKVVPKEEEADAAVEKG